MIIKFTQKNAKIIIEKNCRQNIVSGEIKPHLSLFNNKILLNENYYEILILHFCNQLNVYKFYYHSLKKDEIEKLVANNFFYEKPKYFPEILVYSNDDAEKIKKLKVKPWNSKTIKHYIPFNYTLKGDK